MSFRNYDGVTLEKRKYDVENYTYPDNLFTQVDASQYSNSWVMINVNVQSIGRDAGITSNTIDLNADEVNKRNAVQTINRQRGDTVGSATANVGVKTASITALQSLLNSGLGMNEAAAALGKGGKAGATAALVVGTVYNTAGQATRNTKRLKAAIQLPMPNALITNYGMNWGPQDTMLYDMMARNYTIEDLKTGSASDLGTGAILGLGKFMDMNGISAATGLAANTKLEQIFQGVRMRGFTFLYQFFPKNLKEAQTIRNIIYTLKYHAHPEYKNQTTRMNFIYPSEFDITYFTGDGQENQYIPRTATCILTDITANYAPSNVWVSHQDGIPSLVTLTLQFQELGIITKESIEQGF